VRLLVAVDRFMLAVTLSCFSTVRNDAAFIPCNTQLKELIVLIYLEWLLLRLFIFVIAQVNSDCRPLLTALLSRTSSPLLLPGRAVVMRRTAA